MLTRIISAVVGVILALTLVEAQEPAYSRAEIDSAINIGVRDVVTAARLADTGVGHVVIRPRGDKKGRYTVQPITLDVVESETVINLFGASVELQGVVATFASADVLAIAEDNDVEVILVTTGGEFKCNLDDTRILRGYNLRDD